MLEFFDLIDHNLEFSELLLVPFFDVKSLRTDKLVGFKYLSDSFKFFVVEGFLRDVRILRIVHATLSILDSLPEVCREHIVFGHRLKFSLQLGSDLQFKQLF